jgi:hypothetical protein
MATATTRAMALAMTWLVTKRAWQGQQGQSSPTPLPPLPLSLPPLLQQPSSLLLPPPQLPNNVALSAAMAAPVAIAHLFDTAIKRRLHGQWQRKQMLRQ